MTPEQLRIAKEAVMDTAKEARLCAGSWSDDERPQTNCSVSAIMVRITGDARWWEDEESHVTLEILFKPHAWQHVSDVNDRDLDEGLSQFEVATNVCKKLDELYGEEKP